MSTDSTIIYTLTDEAPLLATAAFLPIIRTFTQAAGVRVEESDISVAGRILGNFAEYLTASQRVPDTLTDLGRKTLEPDANVIKLPNISALVPQLMAAIKELIVGASIRVVAPWGQYDDSKLVNIGTNRWSFKPAVGMSKAIGPWTAELEAAVTLYTDNSDFFGGKSLSQAPLYSMQGHLIYAFNSGIWTSLDATYFVGGRTTVDGTLNSDLQQNWRVGGTLAVPVNRENSVKLYASSGMSSRTGNSYDLFGLAWQYRWGGGL